MSAEMSAKRLSGGVYLAWLLPCPLSIYFIINLMINSLASARSLENMYHASNVYPALLLALLASVRNTIPPRSVVCGSCGGEVDIQ